MLTLVIIVAVTAISVGYSFGYLLGVMDGLRAKKGD